MAKSGIENLTRRELLKLFGLSVAGGMTGLGMPKKVRAQSRTITPRGTARNVVFLQNCGAMSPPETVDLKETKWTAPDLDIQAVSSELKVAKTLFPNYQKWIHKASIVRSFLGGPLVHFPAQYYTQAGRAMNPAIMREIPAFGSVVAYELESQRRPEDVFPTFMSIDLWGTRCPQIGPGMLPPRFAGLDLNTTTIFDSFAGESALSKSTLERRWDLLNQMAEAAPVADAQLGWKAEEYRAHYDYAYDILRNPLFPQVLALTEEEKKRYGVDQDRGACKLGVGMLLARNLLKANAGARFIWVANAYNGGNGVFDNHNAMLDRSPTAGRGSAIPVYMSVPRFESAVASFIDDLESLPGSVAGKTLLDETMIVVAWEFGRTPDMNVSGGRDHWAPCYPGMFIGGGVKPGRIIGRTDEKCASVVDVGWKHRQQPMMDHVASTVYSALGIDYSKKIDDTPSGRSYEYQQTAPLGGPKFIPLSDIEELFV